MHNALNAHVTLEAKQTWQHDGSWYTLPLGGSAAGMPAAGKREPPEFLQLLPQYNYRANAPKMRIRIRPPAHIEGTTEALVTH